MTRLRREFATSSPDLRVLLGCSGSVASIKVPALARELTARGASVAVVPTKCATHFFNPSTIEDVMVFTDEDEWRLWSVRGDPVLHIELMRWANVMLIAPLDANTLGKLANGLADNLLTCVARAWPVGKKPFIVAPAMNTAMFEHPITSQQMSQLVRFGYTTLQPIEKELMCGDVGRGAMALLETIVKAVEDSQRRSLCVLM